MGSNVYFAPFGTHGAERNKTNLIRGIFEKEEFRPLFAKNDITAIKVHFGERGNDSFVSPLSIRQIVDKVKETGAKPFITDTTTLYRGTRANGVDHLETAIYHGFSYSSVNAPIIIADGLKGNNEVSVKINKKHFGCVKIARDIFDANSMAVVSHFKGHMMAGFGGAIKNLAMGCATRFGKQDQHNLKLFVYDDKCIGCGECESACPTEAIKLNPAKASINEELCIGCGECKTVCPEGAIDVNWSTDIVDFMQRMTEYAFGSVINKKGKVLYINFLENITPDCDCVGWSDTPIVPDIGILASTDPVAIDKASYDLVNKQKAWPGSILKTNCNEGEDKFAGLSKNTRGLIQITYGEEIGLGSAQYNLINY